MYHFNADAGAFSVGEIFLQVLRLNALTSAQYMKSQISYEGCTV
jgi:hypothetical protein